MSLSSYAFIFSLFINPAHASASSCDAWLNAPLALPEDLSREPADAASTAGPPTVLTVDGLDRALNVPVADLNDVGHLAREVLRLPEDARTAAWIERTRLHHAIRGTEPTEIEFDPELFAGGAGEVLFTRVQGERAHVSLITRTAAVPVIEGRAAEADLKSDLYLQLPRTTRARYVTWEIAAERPVKKWFDLHLAPALHEKFSASVDGEAFVTTVVRRQAGKKVLPPALYRVRREANAEREVWRVIGGTPVSAVDAFVVDADFIARHPRPAHPLTPFPGDATPVTLMIPEILMRLKAEVDPGQGVSPRSSLNEIFDANPSLTMDLEALPIGAQAFAAAPPEPAAGEAAHFAMFRREADGVYLVAWTPSIKR